MTLDGKIPARHWKYDPCGSYGENSRWAYKKHRVTCFNCLSKLDDLKYSWVIECPNCKKICNGSNKKYCPRCGTKVEVEQHLKHWRDRNSF